VTVTASDETNTGTPLYVPFNTSSFTINPTLYSAYGLHSINLILSDGLLSTAYNFSVNITNSAPYYKNISNNKLPDITINNNQSANITLPDILDDLVPLNVTQSVSPSLPWVSIV
jgi:hypothetical protein